MATLTVSGKSKQTSSKTISATVTYSVSSTNTQTTVTVSNVTWSDGGAGSLDIGATVILDKYDVYSWSEMASGTPPTLPKTYTFTKTTAAQTKNLELHLFELYNDYTEIQTLINSAVITIPALTSYNVTYNANGHGTAPATQKKYYGKTLTLAAAISATGYTFVRWNTAANNTGTGYNAKASYTANAALSLYAIWNHSITYNANGGAGAPATQTALATSAITISSTKPTRDGYRFVRWNTKSDGTGTNYNPGGSLSSGSASITLFAQWAKEITAVTIGSATVKRVEGINRTVEADEGTYAYIRVPVTVTGLAAGNISLSITCTPDSGDVPTITGGTTTAQKLEDSSLTATLTAWAGECDVDVRYIFAITVTATNTTATQAAVSASKSLTLATAFFTMDVKAGGKGIHFGGASTEEGFFVSMFAFFNKLVTLTENLKIEKSSPVVRFYSTNIDSAVGETVPASDTIIGGTSIYDNQGYICGWFRLYKNTADKIFTYMSARRHVGSSDISNGLSLGIEPDGTRYVSVTQAEPWLSALGLTPTSWDTNKVAAYAKQGNVVTVTYSGTATDVEIPTGTWTTLATLPTGYRPDRTVYTTVHFRGWMAGAIRITTAGLVQALVPSSVGNIASSSPAYFSVTFIV